jgi:hypothetical protein
MRRNCTIVGCMAAVLLFALLLAGAFASRPVIHAQARGGGHARASVHGANVNRSVKVNRNVNVNHDVHVSHNVNVHQSYDRWGHPVAAAAAVTAAAVAVGTVVAALPPKCSVIVLNGVTLQQCGSNYYQPVYQGSAVQYVVVKAP